MSISPIKTSAQLTAPAKYGVARCSESSFTPSKFRFLRSVRLVFGVLATVLQRPFIKSLHAVCYCVLLMFATPAFALFGDDEARNAIIQLRARIDAQNLQIQELQARIQKLEAGQRGQFELSNQLEQLRNEVARLRGQTETLARDVAETQRKQKDLYVDLDNRLRKTEPQTVSIDGKQAQVEQTEMRAYDTAQTLFKNGDFKAAVSAFMQFQKTYPKSEYSANVQYWLGNAYYALRDFKQCVAAQGLVLKQYPDSPKAPDALLNTASCQLELNDKKNARKSLEALVAQYPQSAAAATAKERLSSLK